MNELIEASQEAARTFLDGLHVSGPAVRLAVPSLGGTRPKEDPPRAWVTLLPGQAGVVSPGVGRAVPWRGRGATA
jgi:hypothetical protein